MNSIIFIDQPEIKAYSVSSLRCFWHVMKLCGDNSSKIRRLKCLRMSSCLSIGNWFPYLSHLARTTPSIDSSQLLPWQISWGICFPTRTTVAMSPSRSKIELVVASIPLRVHGFSINSILRSNASDSQQTHRGVDIEYALILGWLWKW